MPMFRKENLPSFSGYEKMEAVGFSNLMTNLFQTVHPHIQEDNLNSWLIFQIFLIQ
jgi:hypothetical protein